MVLGDAIQICILSKADSFGGGASKCAEDLSVHLNHAGHTVRHYCYWSGKGYNTLRYPLIGKLNKPVSYFREKLEKRVFGLPEFLPIELPFLLKKGILDYDILHFHDICSAISPLTVFYLAKRKPVVWTFHDCSAFTGGCLYPMACEKYKTVCSRCSQKEWPINSPLTHTALLQRIKKRIFSKTNVTLLAPSEWMANMASGASVLNRKPLVVNNGVDTGLYQAIEKKSARKALSIPEHRYVILISAASFDDERKGFTYAVQGIRQISDLTPYVLVMGKVDAKRIHAELGNVDIRRFGYQSDPKIINTIYAAADVFLFASLADNQPLSILESFASGTPVIAFDTGGIPEMIEPASGAVVKQKQIEGLARELRRFSDKTFSTAMSLSARGLVKEKFGMKLFVDTHITLYRRILAATK
jgi:glycosyltransferase involved in cell wall biosynthesis